MEGSLLGFRCETGKGNNEISVMVPFLSCELEREMDREAISWPEDFVQERWKEGNFKKILVLSLRSKFF